MTNLTNAGRIFYGTVMSGLGLLTIYYRDFPYMMIPPKHSGIPGIAVLVYLFGAMLFLAGACIVLKKQTRTVSLLLGGILLLIFVFYYIPYQLTASPNYMHLVDWENAEKELALCGGAFVIASCFEGRNENTLIRFLGKIAPLGSILFSITMISFGIIHFQYAKDVAEYVPSWVPFRLFWAYFCGAALIGSGLAIILRIKVELVATLLGTMIFIWFAVLHIPRVIVSPVTYLGSEVTSALIALAYSGTAFVIAGRK
jgi:uncharacterized membrane protein YphA (DoxX/SURF4 family)